MASHPLQRRRARLAAFGGTALAYFLVARLSIEGGVLVQPYVSALWPPVGLGLAAALAFGRFTAWAAFAGSWAYFLSVGMRPELGLLIAVCNAAEIAAAVWLLDRVGSNGHSFYNPKDFAIFAALTLLASFLGSAGAVGPLLWTGDQREGFLGLWAIRSMAHWSAMLIITPFLMAWLQHPRLSGSLRHSIEGLALAAALAAASWALFGGGTTLSRENAPLSFILPALALWPAVRMGLRETATTTAFVAVPAVLGTLAGYGPFGAWPGYLGVDILQAFLAALALSSMTLASAVWRAKDTERRLAAVNVELERRVRSRTARLKQVNEELESFAYAVAHDLRSPLRAMSGFSEAVMHDYARCLDTKGTGYLRRIHDASRRMARLIDEMLDLSRVTRREARDETVNLSAAAARIVAELRRREPARRSDIRIEPCLVDHGDPELLETALRHLLDNAWKFTASRALAVIEVGARPREPVPVYFVRDNGVGLDREQARRLLTPFERLGSGGLAAPGLGLATVQRVVQRHGGRFWAEGEPGAGAVFCFTLHDSADRHV